MPAIGWTIGWVVAPVLLYLGWALTRASTAEPDCIDATGEPCRAPRDEALAVLLDNAAGLVGALALALLAAVALRRLTTSWRGGIVGLTAAVVGAGAATALIAALG